MKLSEPKLWVTVDSDDFRHLPKYQGHPVRSRLELPQRYASIEPSLELKSGMEGFSKWIDEGGHATLFIIADQLDSVEFKEWLQKLIGTGKVKIGVHGNTHRSWSAWPEDKEGFASELKIANERIKKFAQNAWRPWFRAPAGYIAPWMAEVLNEQGFKVDSSINPTRLLLSKTGKGRSWRAVEKAMQSNGLVERKWLTSKLLGISLPACGPALHMRSISWLSKRAWNKCKSLERADDSVIEDASANVVTVYWHLLDHAKKAGNWSPPLE